MGLVVVLTADLFICATGKSVTLRKETNLVYTSGYDEIDEATSEYTDSTIKILPIPSEGKTMDWTEHGLKPQREDLEVYFQSNCTVEVGDLIVEGSLSWRVRQLETQSYQGLTVIKGLLRREK